MTKLLFFTPSGGTSGSELLLWQMIQTLDTEQYQVAVYCEQVGELKNKLPKNVPFYTNPFNATGLKRLWLKGKNLLTKNVYEGYILQIHNQFKPDYWYINTVMMAHVAEIAQKQGVKTISHFHELPHIIYELVKAPHLEALVGQSVLCIGNADATCEVIESLGGKNIQKVYPFINFEKILTDNQRVTAIRTSLYIPQNAFVWAIVGAATFAKGLEYLPILAQLFPDAHFVWIGGNTNSGSYYYTQKFIEQKKLKNIHFVGTQRADYYHYLAMSNGLLLLSLEESFGMVNVEAAYLGKPVVAFNSGGVREILSEEMGTLVNSWNVEDFAEAMRAYMNGERFFDAEKAKISIAKFSANEQMKAWHKAIQYLSSESDSH